MHDLRFYHSSGPLRASALAELAGVKYEGKNDPEIYSVASLANASVGEMCFHEGRPQALEQLSPNASLCFVSPEAAENVPDSVDIIVSNQPRAHFNIAAKALLKLRLFNEPISETHHPADVHETAQIGPGVFLSPGVSVGQNTIICPNAVIGPGVQIGHDCHIGPGVSIEAALIGNHVTLKANTVIGGAGFGVVPTPEGLTDAPHFGRVILQDNVSIGACACIDRGLFDDTVMGEGSKTDNLVQIAHNVTFGRSSLMAAQGGLSGSVTIGNGVMMGGQIGVADHTTIHDGARLAADAGVMSDVPSGETWGGMPARPLKRMLREAAWVAQNAKTRKRKSID